MKKLFILVIALFSSNVFAQTFIGKVKGTDAKCELMVIQRYYENNIETPANFRAIVAVTLSDGDSAGERLEFVVRPGARPAFFSGISDNQKDMINIVAQAGTPNLDVPTAFSLKWWHVSHYHTAQCLNLKN